MDYSDLLMALLSTNRPTGAGGMRDWRVPQPRVAPGSTPYGGYSPFFTNRYDYSGENPAAITNTAMPSTADEILARLEFQRANPLTPEGMQMQRNPIENMPLQSSDVMPYPYRAFDITNMPSAPMITNVAPPTPTKAPTAPPVAPSMAPAQTEYANTGPWDEIKPPTGTQAAKGGPWDAIKPPEQKSLTTSLRDWWNMGAGASQVLGDLTGGLFPSAPTTQEIQELPRQMEKVGQGFLNLPEYGTRLDTQLRLNRINKAIGPLEAKRKTGLLSPEETEQLKTLGESRNQQLSIMEEPLPYTEPGQKFVTTEQFEKAVPIAPANLLPRTGWPGVAGRLSSELATGVVTPGTLPFLPFAATKPVEALFAAQTVPGIVEEGIKAYETTGDEQKLHIGSGLINTLFSALLGRGLLRGGPPVPPAPTTPTAPPAAPPPPGIAPGFFGALRVPPIRFGGAEAPIRLGGPLAGGRIPVEGAPPPSPPVLPTEPPGPLKLGGPFVEPPIQLGGPLVEPPIQLPGGPGIPPPEEPPGGPPPGPPPPPAPGGGPPIQFGPPVEPRIQFGPPLEPRISVPGAPPIRPGPPPEAAGPLQMQRPPSPLQTALAGAGRLAEPEVARIRQVLSQYATVPEVMEVARTIEPNDPFRAHKMELVNERIQQLRSPAPAPPPVPTAPTAQPPVIAPPVQAPGAPPGVFAPPIPKRKIAVKKPGLTMDEMQERTPQLHHVVDLYKSAMSGVKAGPTIGGYTPSFSKYAKWLSERGIDANTPGALFKFFDEIKDPNSPYFIEETSRKPVKNAFGALHTFLRKRGHTAAEMFKDIEQIEVPMGVSEETPALRSDQFRRLYSVITQSQLPFAARTRAAAALQYHHFPRIGDMNTLRMEDVNWTDHTIRLYRGTKMAGTFKLEPEAFRALYDYVAGEGRLNDGPNELLFRGDRGEKYSTTSYNTDLRTLAEEAGIGDVTSHMLRATGATLSGARGMPYQEIQRRGGWSKGVPTTYLKAERLGDKIDPFDPDYEHKLQQEIEAERTRYDPQSQRGIQGGVPQGQEPGQVPQPSGGQETPPAGGVFQAPGEVGPPGGRPLQSPRSLQVPGFPEEEPTPRTPAEFAALKERRAAAEQRQVSAEQRLGMERMRQPDDFQRLEALRAQIMDLLEDSRKAEPARREAIYRQLGELRKQVDVIKARNRPGGRPLSSTADLQAFGMPEGEEPTPRTPEEFASLKERRALEAREEERAAGRPIQPTDLRPAIKFPGRNLIGEPGDQHADVLSRNGMRPSSIPHEDPRRGFVDVNHPERFLTRIEAEQRSGLQGTAMAGGLDSMDIPVGDTERARLMAEIERDFPAEEPPRPEDLPPPRGTRFYTGSLLAPEEPGSGMGGAPPRQRGFGAPPILPPAVKAAGVPLPKGTGAPPTLTKKQQVIDSLKTVNATPFERPRGVARAVGKRVGEVGYGTDAVRRLSNAASSAVFKARKGLTTILPIDAIFDSLEGGRGKYNGWLFKNLRFPIDNASNASYIRRDSYLLPVDNLVKKYKLDNINGQRIGIYAHAQQEGGIERMMEGGIARGEIDEIVKSMTPQELEVYRLMRQHMDSSLPLVQRLAKKLYNRDVTAEKNYFPWLRAWEVYENEPTKLIEPERGGPAGPEIAHFKELGQDYNLEQGVETEQGFTISRVPESVSPIKLNAFDIYARHMRDVAHFVEMQEVLHDAARVARTRDFRAKFGNVGQQYVMDWLNTVASQGRSIKPIAWLDSLRRRTTIGVIAGRLASQFVHLANVPFGIQRVGGPVAYMRGVREVMTGGARMEKFMQERFKESYERSGSEPTLAEVSETGPRRGRATRLGFAIQKFIDKKNAQATMLGYYMEGLQRKGLNPLDYDRLPFDQELANKARVAARRAVASPLPKDIPPVLARGGSLARLFFQFQNTFLDQWSNIYHDLWGTSLKSGMDFLHGENARGIEGAKYAAGMMVATMGMFAVETLIKHGFQWGIHKATGYDPRQPTTIKDRFIHELIRRLPVISQLYSAIKYNETGVPAFDVARTLGRGVYKKVFGEEELDPYVTSVDIVKSAAEVAGIPFASQIGEGVASYRRGYLQKRGEYEMRREGAKLFPGVQRYGLGQRVQIARGLAEERPPESIAKREELEKRGAVAVAARRRELTKAMSSEQQDWLKRNTLYLAGFKNTVRLGGQTVQLTRDEQDFYQNALVEEYKKTIDQVSKRGQLEKFPSQKMKTDLWSRYQTRIHQAAEAKLLRFMQQGGTTEKTKAPFSIFREE